jgi:GDP-L-fucose synthase
MSNIKSETIFVAGHTGMVGSAIIHKLRQAGFKNLITKNRNELDLTNQKEVHKFFSENKIDQVYLAAAKVGGIYANKTYPAEFIYDNLMIEANVIHAAFEAGVKKLMFLGSSCIYPKFANQPLAEEALMTGVLEPTNEPYAIAKIAGIKLCESYNRQYGVDYRSVMPTNLYGPNDNFHLENSHVIPALIRRFHEAVTRGDENVNIWGSGKPKREFLHVDDMAEASIYVNLLDKETYSKHTQPMQSHINVGSGIDCSIKELAEIIAMVTKFKGKLIFDTTKPDGTPRKLMDVSRLKELGWRASICLEEGLKLTYQWFLDNQQRFRQ